MLFKATPDLPGTAAEPREAPPAPSEIERAAAVLANGGLVAFPTETVYGLGADAENEDAVSRIFAAKRRPTSHPLILHLASPAMIERYASSIPESAWKLAESFWPGPLTLILKRNQGVSDLITGGQDTVGLRVPSHPVAQDLLGTFGKAVAAPSANRFGRISPTRAEHVVSELGNSVELILDGGLCTVGLESTILDLSRETPALLRPGAITPKMLAEVLGQLPDAAGDNKPRVPGQMASHYAPRTPMHLVDPEDLAKLSLGLDTGGTLAVMAFGPPPEALPPEICWRLMPSKQSDYARSLYAYLREVDDQGHACLLVERPPLTPDWNAVQDRLARAASRPC